MASKVPGQAALEAMIRRQESSRGLVDVPFEELDAQIEALMSRVVRAELRRCGLRPPVPSEYGVWRWNAETDAWERSDG